MHSPAAFDRRVLVIKNSLCFGLSLTLILSVIACAKRSRVSQHANEGQSNRAQNSTSPQRTQLININTASAEELEALPGIGRALAERIIEHREKYGPFRRPEHLIIVRGISDKRFRALKDLINVE